MPGAGRSFHMVRGRMYRGKRRYRKKLATVATVKKMINSNEERKFVDTLTVSTTLEPDSTGGTITYISGISEGDGQENREGRECRLRSLEIKGSIKDTGSAGTDVITRMVIVRKLGDANGAAPTISDIYDSATDYRTLPAVVYKGEYQVLMDKVITHPRFGVAATSANRTSMVNFYKSWKKARKLTYLGAGSTIVTAGRGHYFLICWSNQPATDNPQVNLNIRLSFTG